MCANIFPNPFFTRSRRGEGYGDLNPRISSEFLIGSRIFGHLGNSGLRHSVMAVFFHRICASTSKIRFEYSRQLSKGRRNEKGKKLSVANVAKI